MSDEIKDEEIQSEEKEVKPAKAGNPVKAKAEEIAPVRADGKIAFIKDGVTIWRNKADSSALGLAGWIKK